MKKINRVCRSSDPVPVQWLCYTVAASWVIVEYDKLHFVLQVERTVSLCKVL